MPQSQITEEEIKQSEVLRYLGYRGQKADETIMEQIRECIRISPVWQAADLRILD